jgi:hypothetical protein
MVAALALVAFVLVFGVALPMADRAASLAVKQSKLRAQIAEAAKLFGRTPAMEQEIETLRADSAKLVVAHGDPKVAVVHEIDQLASDLNLRVTSMKPPGDAEPVGGLLRYPASFKVESDFSHVVRLLYELERPERRLWVETVEITTSGRAAGDELQVSISVAVYVPGTGGEQDHAKT